MATEGDLVKGIAWASPWKLRGAYDWTAEVSVYVRNGHEGQGIGRDLCSRMLEIMDMQGYHAIVAVIALPNEASVALHQSLGFELGGTLKRLGYKNGQWRDVVYRQRLHAERRRQQRAAGAQAGQRSRGLASRTKRWGVAGSIRRHPIGASGGG